ncbi:MAG: GAF domain-containing sensor histidine kinase [Ktedonobacterales bacterium]
MTQSAEPTGSQGSGGDGERTKPGILHQLDRLRSLASVSWLLLVLLVIGLIAASIPTYIAYLHLPRMAPASAADNPGGQLTPAGLQELHTLGLSLNVYILFLVVCNLLLVAGYLGVGTLLFWRLWGRSRESIAFWASCALVSFPVNAVAVMLGTLPTTWDMPIALLRFLGGACLLLFGYLFPTGWFVPRWTGLLAGTSVATWAVYSFVPAAASPSNPLAGIIFVLFLGSLGSLIVVQVYRYRRVSNRVQQQQIKWVVYGLGISVGGYILWAGLFALLFFHGRFADVLVRSLFTLSQVVLLLCIPFSIGFAILRYRLWDIDLFINRTLVYGALTACVLGIYTLIVGGVGTLLQARGNLGLALLATGLIAVLVQPLQTRLQRAVNRLMYGERGDPYKVISHLVQRLGATLAPEAVLPAIVETVAQALKLPYVAISLRQDGEPVLVASYGADPGGDQSGFSHHLLKLPLVYQTEELGLFLLAPRAPGEPFSLADRALLTDLAHQAGMAMHAVRVSTDLQRLTGALQRSRTQLVTAREEERRRLRRDLHDGLGSVLTSLNWRAGALRSLLTRDPVAADALVLEQQHTIQAALADIRRLVYDLSPPALDELGLLGAIRERAAQLTKRAGQSNVGGLCVDVLAPEQFPALSAAVEVAAYRIVQEALANVLRHAQARHCQICLSCDEEQLQVDVRDDGIGLPEVHHTGVGLLSMRERAAELGGTCLVMQLPTGGTQIHAFLPLPKEAGEE